ncbi:hypothetical protein [Hymenobacter agri]
MDNPTCKAATTMMSTNSRRLFAQAFGTFKVFYGLTVASSSLGQQAFSSSVWQILFGAVARPRQEAVYSKGLAES